MARARSFAGTVAGVHIDSYVWIGVAVPLGAGLIGLWRGRRDHAIEWGVAVAPLAAAVAIWASAGGPEERIPSEQFAQGVVLFALLAGLVPAAAFYAIAAWLTRKPLLAAAALGVAGGLYVFGFWIVYILAATLITCSPDNQGCLF